MRRATQKRQARQQKRNVKARKRKARVTASADYRSWQDRDRTSKRRPGASHMQIMRAASTAALLAQANR